MRARLSKQVCAGNARSSPAVSVAMSRHGTQIRSRTYQIVDRGTTMTDFAPVHMHESVSPGTVAVVGLGQMGLPIALRLLAAGFRVAGYRRREPPGAVSRSRRAWLPEPGAGDRQLSDRVNGAPIGRGSDVCCDRR